MGKRLAARFSLQTKPSDGQDGTSVAIDTQNTFTKYTGSNSGTTHPVSTSDVWKLNPPLVPDGQYLWTWVHTAYTDGNATDAYSVSRMGIDGKGIQNSETKYCQKANTNTAPENFPESDWGTFPTTLINDYWLYSRTIVTYSDGDHATSYDVQQIGQGSYYAGCQEYYNVSDSSTTAPSGYPDAKQFVNGVALYANGETVTIGSSWSSNRPTATYSSPYIWNFEISYDSRGNKYVTQPICIGNFARGIASIVETYAISAYSYDNSTTNPKRGYPTDITSWTDEQQDAAPTAAKPYQWNKTVVTYNGGDPETFYHVSAVRGANGVNGKTRWLVPSVTEVKRYRTGEA